MSEGSAIIIIIGCVVVVIIVIITLVKAGSLKHQVTVEQRGEYSTTAYATVINVEHGKYGDTITIEFSNGERKNLSPPLRSGMILVTGDKGYATYQGGSLLRFERDK